MRRLVVLIVIAAVAGPHLAARAQDATPAASPVAGAPLDLAAMTLIPRDLDAAGLPSFGLANQSSLRDAETDALVQAGGDALEAAERLAAYRDAGFRSRYVGSLLRPRIPLFRLPTGLLAADQRISSAVTEYATEAGAAAGFAFTEGPADDQPGRDVPGPRTFGDESDLTRSVGTELQTGNPLQRLELAFRIGNLVAEVTFVDYTNAEPDVATVERLGDALRAKVERGGAGGGPGLSFRALRLAPLAPWIEGARLRDFYTRRGGQVEPTFAQIVAAIREGATPEAATPVPAPGTLLPSDTFMFWTPVGEGDPLELPLYVAWLDRFPSPEQAAASLRRQSTDLGEGYVDVQEHRTAERVGDESRAFAYAYEGDPTNPARGHLVVARAGNVVVRVLEDGPSGVRRAGVEELARRQVACVGEPGVCSPIPALEALARLVTEPSGP